MSPIRPAVYVEGVAVEVSWGDATRSLGELIFDTVDAAVVDSGHSIDDVDSVVLAAHDLVDGRSLSSMVTAPAAGCYLRDEVRMGDDGATAFATAVTRLEAGHARRSVVAAWGRASEHDVDAVSRALFEPFCLGPLGMSELAVSALRAQSWLAAHPGSNGERELAAARRTAAAARNPRALHRGGRLSQAPYPLAISELPVWADVTAAMVLSTDETAIRLAGLGQSSEPSRIGDRDLLAMPAVRDAVGRALSEAGLGQAEIDVIEIDGLTLFDEALALEAAGFAPSGGGLHLLANDPRCNPSGGGAAGYCAPAMGLARIVEAVLQLRGTAGGIQQPDTRRVLATGCSTAAAQTQTAVILEAA